MDEQVQTEALPSPEVQVVVYEGDKLIIPTTSSWFFQVKDFIKLGLEVDPEVRQILWNDIVAHFAVHPDGISLEW